MDAATLQNRIYKGYDKAAIRIGTDFSIYRSSSAIAPVSPANIVGSLKCSFNNSWNYMKAKGYGNPVQQLVADGTLLEAGDYLSDGTQTYFLAGKELILPMQAVYCNAVVTIARPEQVTGNGYVGYADYQPSTAMTLYKDCPASLLEGGKMSDSGAGLPTSAKLSGCRLLLPFLGGVDIRAGDIIDADGARYMISTHELTDYGWRILCYEVGA